MNGKFRVWNESLKQWVDPTVCFLNTDGVFFTFDGGLHKAAPHYKAIFSTGLHDKNGKEIWEGDILDNGKEVKFGEFYAYLENGLGGGYHITGFYYDDDVAVPVEGRHHEVLGNVFENPELLDYWS